MKIKCVSLSSYSLNLSSYIFTKMDLFEFLFTQIILNENIDKNKSLISVLNDLDIKEDLYYLFNNVYYKFLDNKIIESNKEDIYDLELKDIKINEVFIKYLKEKKLPIKKDKIDKDYIYDILMDKLVVNNINNEDSNLVCFIKDNSLKSIQELTNRFSKALFNSNEGLYLVNSAIINPYYFDLELEKIDSKLVYKKDNQDLVYSSLVKNSLFINSNKLQGEYLSSNIYFDYVFTNTDKINNNAKYVFKLDKEKEGLVKDNIIYVNYDKFNDCDFVDIKNKLKYVTGTMLLINNEKISTFKANKDNSVSDFKLYLIKNKNKFKCNINKILEEI